jgi:hypothetical protein
LQPSTRAPPTNWFFARSLRSHARRYLSAFISGRGVAPDDTPLLVSALTAPVFATALVRLLGEVPAAQVQAPRVLAVVRPCMALGVLGELKPAEGKRLAK